MFQRTTSELHVTVLGLGAMGYAMATNLLKKGMQVTGFDVSQTALERFVNAGGYSASTLQEAVSSADFVVVMVTNATQVTSTVTPDFHDTITSRLANEFNRRDIQVLDCPVSGGVVGAENGTLSIFSSGPTEVLKNARPLLDALGTNVYTIPAGLGSGSKAKMCHQVLPEIDIALCAEAMALAARAGLNTKEVFDAVQASDGSSWIVGDRVQHMIDGDLRQYSVIPNSSKDSSIIMHMAAEIQLPMPLVSAALQVYQSAIHARWTNDDDSTLWRLYLNGHGDDAIYRQTVPAPPISKSDKFDNQDIVDIFAGVHLAASIEAIRFVHALGLDADIMFDIISNAAGSNAQFVQSVPQMRRDAPSLRDVQGSQVTCERLRNAASKANSIGAPLPVASAALQAFLMDIALPEINSAIMDDA